MQLIIRNGNNDISGVIPLPQVQSWSDVEGQAGAVESHDHVVLRGKQDKGASIVGECSRVYRLWQALKRCPGLGGQAEGLHGGLPVVWSPVGVVRIASFMKKRLIDYPFD